MLSIHPVSIKFSDIDAETWNKFAQQAGCSYLCSFEYIRMIGRVRKIRLFEYYAICDKKIAIKIGQAAIVGRNGNYQFLDSIQVLPEDMHSMPAILRSTFEFMGSGQYKYGSRWNLNSISLSMLEQSGARNLSVAESFHIQYVDLSDWSSWAAYFGSISKNIRRNIKKSKKTAALKHPSGISQSLIFLFSFFLARIDLSRRKNLKINEIKLMIRLSIRSFFLKKYKIHASCYDEKERSFISSIRYGINEYYLEGASRNNKNGSSWLLIMNSIQSLHENTGGVGRFVFGHNPVEQIIIDEKWLNVIESRRRCRVKNAPAMIIDFLY